MSAAASPVSLIGVLDEIAAFTSTSAATGAWVFDQPPMQDVLKEACEWAQTEAARIKNLDLCDEEKLVALQKVKEVYSNFKRTLFEMTYCSRVEFEGEGVIMDAAVLADAASMLVRYIKKHGLNAEPSPQKLLEHIDALLNCARQPAGSYSHPAHPEIESPDATLQEFRNFLLSRLKNIYQKFLVELNLKAEEDAYFSYLIEQQVPELFARYTYLFRGIDGISSRLMMCERAISASDNPSLRGYAEGLVDEVLRGDILPSVAVEQLEQNIWGYWKCVNTFVSILYRLWTVFESNPLAWDGFKQLGVAQLTYYCENLTISPAERDAQVRAAIELRYPGIIKSIENAWGTQSFVVFQMPDGAYTVGSSDTAGDPALGGSGAAAAER